MKRIVLLFAIFCSVISAKAQMGVGGGGSTITGRISGTVIDSLTHKPLDYATVSIFRSGGKAPLNGVLTDDKGNFKLDNIKPGSYKLAISYIGYPTKVIDPVTTTLSKPDKNLGDVIVAPSAKALKEVQVTGARALIENKIDKIVFNAEKDITSTGGNASDVLQKVPLVSVDINGNVSVRGDQNVRVLINGKPSGAVAASVSDVLKTIPADQIKSVEVITSPSAKYDAEGSAGIINIITKSKNMSGISGSVSGGVGTRQNNGNVNLNYTKNRFNINGNLGGNYTWPQTTKSSFDQVFTAGGQSHGTSESTVKRYGGIGSIQAGYDFNNFNSLSSTFRLNQGGFNVHGSGQTLNSGYADASRNISYLTTVSTHNKLSGFDWNLDYTHKFKKEGHELTLSGQWSHSSINTDFDNTYTAVNPNQQSNNDGINNEYTAQVDYTLPASKLLKIEAGGKSILRRINSNYDVYDSTNPNNPIYDNLNSNLYNYHQNVLAGYTVLTFTLPKSYSIMAGARLENTDITGDPTNTLQGLSPFTQNYNTFIPSLTLQKMINASNTIKLTYSKRIQRPSLTYLNPFINRTSVQSQSVGNPTLSPEVSQTVEFNYNTFIGTSVINASVYYKHTGGLIEGIASPITETINGRTIIGTRTAYTNIGQNNSIGGSLFGSVSPVKALTIRGSINAYTYKPDPAGIYKTTATQNGTYIQYTAFLSGSLDMGHNLVAEAFVFTNSPRRTIQGTNPAFSMYVIGAKKQFWNKKAAIGLNTFTPFSKYINFNQNISSPAFTQSSKTAFPFRSVGLSFSYSFGKVNFTQQQPKKGINNDDLKQGDQNGGGTGAPTGGGGR